MTPSSPAGGLDFRIRQLGRYFLTGGAAAIVDLGAFILLIGSGMAIAAAAVLSFFAAMIVNYLLSARYAFRRDAKPSRFLVFAGFACVGLLVNVGVTLAASEVLDIAALAKAIGIGTAFLFNFAVNAFVVFR